MQKRFLAILAMVATVFAFGVGTALAERPDREAGHPACQKEDPPAGCADDGHPGNPDEEEPEEPTDPGGTPGPEALCEALGQIDSALEDACLELVGALTGGGAPTFPPEDFPPGGGGDPSLPPFPPEDFPPGGGGGEFDCEQLGAVPGVGPDLAAGCEELSGGGAPTFPPEGFPPGGGDPTLPPFPPEGLPPIPPEGGDGPSCDQLSAVPGVGPQLAAGCDELTSQLPVPPA